MTKLRLGDGEQVIDLTPTALENLFQPTREKYPANKYFKNYVTIINSAENLSAKLYSYTYNLSQVNWHLDYEVFDPMKSELHLLVGENCLASLQVCLMYFDKFLEDVYEFVKSLGGEKLARQGEAISLCKQTHKRCKDTISPLINMIKHQGMFIDEFNKYLTMYGKTVVMRGFYLWSFGEHGQDAFHFDQKLRNGKTFSFTMLGWQILCCICDVAQTLIPLIMTERRTNAYTGPDVSHFLQRSVSRLMRLPIYAFADFDYLSKITIVCEDRKFEGREFELGTTEPRYGSPLSPYGLPMVFGSAEPRKVRDIGEVAGMMWNGVAWVSGFTDPSYTIIRPRKGEA